MMNPLWNVRTRFNLKLLNCKYLNTKVINNVTTEFKDTKSSTVDNQDVENHSKIAEHWWNPNGPMKALHSLNLLRVPFVRDGIVDVDVQKRTLLPLKDKRILDVGCGGGIFCEPLARLGAQVTGIDASQSLIDLASEHSSKNKHLTVQPNYICTTVEDHIKSHPESYDAVIASEVLEHVNQQDLFVKSCVQAAKPGGKIFFTTPNRTKIAEIGVIYLAEYLLCIVPKGTHQIDKFVTPPELTLWLERNNCHVQMTHGMIFNPITQKWSWTTSDVFAYALQATKLLDIEEKL